MILISPALSAAMTCIMSALVTMEAFAASHKLVFWGNDVMIVIGSYGGLLIALDRFESYLPCWHPRMFICNAYHFDLNGCFRLNWWLLYAKYFA